MEVEQRLKMIENKTLYFSINSVGKWAFIPKKKNTMGLFLGKVKIASFFENTTDPTKKRFIVHCRVPTVMKNLGSFDTELECVRECEEVVRFYISQLNSEHQ
jgi:hypothetical protein